MQASQELMILPRFLRVCLLLPVWRLEAFFFTHVLLPFPFLFRWLQALDLHFSNGIVRASVRDKRPDESCGETSGGRRSPSFSPPGRGSSVRHLVVLST